VNDKPGGKPARQRTGQQGETLAAEFLRNQGYAIITINWNCPGGELDIVAQSGELWVFVEVRTRHAVSSEHAFASILPAKRDRMMKAIYAYLEAHNLSDTIPWRVDVIAVTLRQHQQPLIEQVEDAFDW
jgi:putative endonuclease